MRGVAVCAGAVRVLDLRGLQRQRRHIFHSSVCSNPYDVIIDENYRSASSFEVNGVLIHHPTLSSIVCHLPT